jgi:CheY-like chemotaxis protein
LCWLTIIGKCARRVAKLIGSEFDIIASVADGQAIESAIRLNPDILVLDISMPFRNASKSNVAGCSLRNLFGWLLVAKLL